MMRKAANLLTPQHIIEQKGDNFNLVRLPSSRLDVLLGVHFLESDDWAF